jgi:hypothetical protein
MVKPLVTRAAAPEISGAAGGNGMRMAIKFAGQ